MQHVGLATQLHFPRPITARLQFGRMCFLLPVSKNPGPRIATLRLSGGYIVIGSAKLIWTYLDSGQCQFKKQIIGIELLKKEPPQHTVQSSVRHVKHELFRSNLTISQKTKQRNTKSTPQQQVATDAGNSTHLSGQSCDSFLTGLTLRQSKGIDDSRARICENHRIYIIR